MNLTYAAGDLRRNKGVNIALLIVLVLSAFLMATGAMVMERMFGSVGALFDEARPPHFLQMHKGEYDEDALDKFAAEHPEIDDWLVTRMLGYDGAAIAWQTGTESGDLSASVLENLFTVQNEGFDLLLDESGAAPYPAGNAVYVPVAHQQRFDLEIGDSLRVQTATGVEELTIAGFVRDAQMASSLSAATRFVVSEDTFASLQDAGGGAPEIIVEYLLEDSSLASDLQSAYESDQALPKNGQAVTIDMIRLINAISDGLVAVALIFVSLVLIAIALLNVRFVIRGTLQDEVREIGAMKAMGLPNSAISALYLGKYGVMTFASCMIGGVLAIFAADALTRNVQANYAPAPITAATILVPVVALILVFVIVLAICRGVLASIRRIEVVSALVHGSTLDEKQTAARAKRKARSVRRSAFENYRGGNMNRTLAFHELRADAREWLLIPLVFLLATVLVTLPTSILSTFESPKFVTYMGAPQADLRIDVQFAASVDAIRGEVTEALEQDVRVTEVQTFANYLYEVESDRDVWETFRVEVGDYSVETIAFTSGAAPQAGEIAISSLNASELGLGIHDELTIRKDGGEQTLTVSGVYQDVTSGGLTAKMQAPAASTSAAPSTSTAPSTSIEPGASSYVIYANVSEGTDPTALAEELQERFPAASVVPMAEYVEQTLAYVTDALRNAAVLALVFAVGVAILITVLYLNLRISRQRGELKSLSALGFSGSELAGQLRLQVLVCVVLGTVLGVLVTAALGVLSPLPLTPNPWLVYFAYPLALIVSGYFSAAAVANRLKRA